MSYRLTFNAILVFGRAQHLILLRFALIFNFSTSGAIILSPKGGPSPPFVLSGNNNFLDRRNRRPTLLFLLYIMSLIFLTGETGTTGGQLFL